MFFFLGILKTCLVLMEENIVKIEAITGESLGTRSMATYVETTDVSVFIDPGVALAPSRWRLSPHDKEKKEKRKAWQRIERKVKQSDIIVITHYHYDHYNPQHPELFAGKQVLLKAPKNKINKSQQGRATSFLASIKELEEEQQPSEIIRCDGKTFSWGETTLTLSKPMPHGAKERLGFVLETCIDDGKEKLVHTSDVEGPPLERQANFIIEHKPEYITLDGPMTYLLGFRYPKNALKASIDHIKDILRQCPVQKLAIDHHALRKKEWKKPLKDAFEGNEEKITTMAGLAGKKIRLLEAYRRELYGKGEARGPLLKVPGIGEKMKERLLDRFEDLEAVRKAEKSELTQVNGIGEKTAQNIIEKLPEESNQENEGDKPF